MQKCYTKGLVNVFVPRGWEPVPSFFELVQTVYQNEIRTKFSIPLLKFRRERGHHYGCNGLIVLCAHSTPETPYNLLKTCEICLTIIIDLEAIARTLVKVTCVDDAGGLETWSLEL